jgi:hypothetical protein
MHVLSGYLALKLDKELVIQEASELSAVLVFEFHPAGFHWIPTFRSSQLAFDIDLPSAPLATSSSVRFSNLI